LDIATGHGTVCQSLSQCHQWCHCTVPAELEVVLAGLSKSYCLLLNDRHLPATSFARTKRAIVGLITHGFREKSPELPLTQLRTWTDGESPALKVNLSSISGAHSCVHSNLRSTSWLHIASSCCGGDGVRWSCEMSGVRSSPAGQDLAAETSCAGADRALLALLHDSRGLQLALKGEKWSEGCFRPSAPVCETDKRPLSLLIANIGPLQSDRDLVSASRAHWAVLCCWGVGRHPYLGSAATLHPKSKL
jgi:hypothetical protein